ncbi:ECF RNA polymerase sigma factor SigW [Arenibacter antarcticus]|uniref:RNA polymerase sigma-70 factor n=1 Tax=Arenibacter antarcticus TaxID=2040469 RepID=A0ABW5VFQ3_9FLAO|nr:RNA polymerase sigma-70 factor [Arenibacter sp. H213]
MRKGDIKAYETLFRLYYDKLLHIAKGYLGNLEDAEGIVQNVFIKVWERKSEFGKIKSINNYLYTMTKNSCLDHIKHLKVKESFSKTFYNEKTAINYQFIKDEAAATILEEELELRINLAIELLPEKCKKVFIKSRIEGMKHADIAKTLNISKRTVDNHISNALKHMKFHLKEFLTLFFITFL